MGFWTNNPARNKNFGIQLPDNETLDWVKIRQVKFKRKEKNDGFHKIELEQRQATY